MKTRKNNYRPTYDSGNQGKSCYTLFIDESGLFTREGTEESPKLATKGDWVVAGLFVPSTFGKAEAALERCLPSIITEYGVRGKHDMHLTILRQKLGLETATMLCSRVLDSAVQAIPGTILVAAYAQSSLGISERERNYRTMLMDLITLSETSLAQDEPINELELVISIRTDGFGNITTTHSELRDETIRGIQSALEAELASRGLVDALRKNRIIQRLEHNTEHWGTIVADFIANTVYNRRHSDSGSIIDKFQSDGNLRLFTSFGGWAERRARVAERDGELVTALFRWSIITGLPENKQNKNEYHIELERSNALKRIIKRLLERERASSPRRSFEDFLERVQSARDITDTNRFHAISDVLAVINDASNKSKWFAIRFRLQTYLLFLANRLADSSLAAPLVRSLRKEQARLWLHPEEFSLALEFYPLGSEAAINALDFSHARDLGEEYCRVVNHWRDVWSLLSSPGDGPDTVELGTDLDTLADTIMFDKTRTSIRATSVILRTSVLNIDVTMHDSHVFHDGIITLSDKILAAADFAEGADRRRLLGYGVHAFLRQGKWLDAVAAASALQAETPKSNDTFEWYWVLRAVADSLLAGSMNTTTANHIYAEACERFRGQRDEAKDDSSKDTTPLFLIRRELGVLGVLLKGDERAAHRDWNAAINLLEVRPIASGLSIWLLLLIHWHIEIMAKKRLLEKEELEKMLFNLSNRYNSCPKNDLYNCANMLNISWNSINTNNSILAMRYARLISPY